MTKLCRNCFSKLNETDLVCNVCKIERNKEKKSFTKEEKKITYWCRTLHIIGFLSIIGGSLGIAIGLLSLFAKTANTIFVIINLLLAGIFLYFGLSLRKFARWCYVGGIILYPISIIFALLDKNILSVIISILFLYYLASPITKKILYREL